MHTILLDANSSYHIRVPSADQWAQLIELGQSFVAYDQSLPSEQQSSYTPYVTKMLETCIPLYETYQTSETQRLIASEAVKRLDEQVIQLTRKIHRIIKGVLFETPEKAEEWGFQVKQTTQSILMPRSRRGRLAMLKKYIAKEESRSAEERFTSPQLDTVIQVQANMMTHLAARRNGRDRRKSSRVARDEAFSKLVDILRLAAGQLMVQHFDHKISFEMQQWGFVVIERQNGRNSHNEEEFVELTAPESIHLEPGSNGNSSLNGSAETFIDLQEQATS